LKKSLRASYLILKRIENMPKHAEKIVIPSTRLRLREIQQIIFDCFQEKIKDEDAIKKIRGIVKEG